MWYDSVWLQSLIFASFNSEVNPIINLFILLGKKNSEIVCLLSYGNVHQLGPVFCLLVILCIYKCLSYLIHVLLFLVVVRSDCAGGQLLLEAVVVARGWGPVVQHGGQPELQMGRILSLSSNLGQSACKQSPAPPSPKFQITQLSPQIKSFKEKCIYLG